MYATSFGKLRTLNTRVVALTTDHDQINNTYIDVQDVHKYLSLNKRVCKCYLCGIAVVLSNALVQLATLILTHVLFDDMFLVTTGAKLYRALPCSRLSTAIRTVCSSSGSYASKSA